MSSRTRASRALITGSLILASVMGVAAFRTSAHAPGTAVAGGIADYQVKTATSITLGPGTNPTTVATKAVPAGRYLVTGMIGVNTQPGSFIVCALSNTQNGNDGIFGTFTNQWTFGAQENVHESEVLTIHSGQVIHLTCDDNNGKPNNVVGEVVIEAVPVNFLG